MESQSPSRSSAASLLSSQPRCPQRVFSNESACFSKRRQGKGRKANMSYKLFEPMCALRDVHTATQIAKICFAHKGHPTTPSCLHVYTLHDVNKFLHNSVGARPPKCTSIYVVYLAANKKRNMDDMDSTSNFYVLSFSLQDSTRICIHTSGTSYSSKAARA
jgi:hypothetical protein